MTLLKRTIFLFYISIFLVATSEANAAGSAHEYYKFVRLKCDTAASLASVAQGGVNDGRTDLDGFLKAFDDAVAHHMGNLSKSDRDIAREVGSIIIGAHARVAPEKAEAQIRKQCLSHPEDFAIYP